MDIAIALSCGVLTWFALYDTHHFGVLQHYWYSVAVAWAASLTLALRSRVPEIPAVAALMAAFYTDDRTPLIFAAYALVAYGRRLRWAEIAAIAACYIVVREVSVPVAGGRKPVHFAFATIILPAVYGETVRRYRAATDALRTRARQASASVDQAADLAVLEERTRIAQRTHDNLGHHLTVLTLQSAALREKARDGELRENADLVAESARAAMAEVRETLDMLQDPGGRDSVDADFDFGRFLASLARNMRAGGMDVRHTVESGMNDLPPEDAQLLRRIAREGLTNVAKYAPGASVSLRLYADLGEVALEVGNSPGQGPRIVVDSGGEGLPCLAAATEKAGGRFLARRRPEGGFLLRATLPDRRRGTQDQSL
ncbi:sensor histidine kinase [Streptomyces sp. N35]|uniref:sensor histidine kinase n=1 Tax=Streptomyces sp. N35 TaxID=2795730 RepID=UPI0018F70540|nr:histidine kinase [Streptomyces sp. N35]